MYQMSYIRLQWNIMRQRNNWTRQQNNSIWNYFDEWEGIGKHQRNDYVRQGIK